MSAMEDPASPMDLRARLHELAHPSMDLARDVERRERLINTVIGGLAVLELRAIWDAPRGFRGAAAATTLRAAAGAAGTRAALARVANLVVGRGFDAERHVLRECGLQLGGLPWPERRDDADAFWALGYTHASACAALALLDAAYSDGRWAVVFGAEYAAVVGSLGDGAPVLVDLAARPLGYAPAPLLARVLRQPRFLVLDARRCVPTLERTGVFVRRPMPAWAPCAGAEAFAAAWDSGGIPAADRWAADAPAAERPRRAPAAVFAADGEWLALKREGCRHFAERSVRRGERLASLAAAEGAYLAALDRCRRSRRPSAEVTADGDHWAAVPRLLGNIAACAAEAGRAIDAVFYCDCALAWPAAGAAAARAKVVARRTRAAAALGGEPETWPSLSIVVPTTAARTRFAANTLACFDARDSA